MLLITLYMYVCVYWRSKQANEQKTDKKYQPKCNNKSKKQFAMKTDFHTFCPLSRWFVLFSEFTFSLTVYVDQFDANTFIAKLVEGKFFHTILHSRKERKNEDKKPSSPKKNEERIERNGFILFVCDAFRFLVGSFVSTIFEKIKAKGWKKQNEKVMKQIPATHTPPTEITTKSTHL